MMQNGVPKGIRLNEKHSPIVFFAINYKRKLHFSGISLLRASYIPFLEIFGGRFARYLFEITECRGSGAKTDIVECRNI